MVMRKISLIHITFYAVISYPQIGYKHKDVSNGLIFMFSEFKPGGLELKVPDSQTHQNELSIYICSLKNRREVEEGGL